VGEEMSDRVSAEDNGPVWVRREIHTTIGTEVILVCVCQKCKESTAPVHYFMDATFDPELLARRIE
jgi:hypothetical protein